jgi:hypothetical protein
MRAGGGGNVQEAGESTMKGNEGTSGVSGRMCSHMVLLTYDGPKSVSHRRVNLPMMAQ